MLRGETRVDPFNSYVDPVLAHLTYVRIAKDPFPTPEEAQVWFQLGDQQKSAFVPLRIVNEEAQTVRAVLVGELDEKILVCFPATNWGQSRLYASESDLERIAQVPTK